MEHILITKRLVLTPVADADQAELAAHWTDPDVRRFLFDGAALSPAEISQTVADSAASFAAHGYGLWLVRGRGGHDDHGGHGDDSLVGTAGGCAPWRTSASRSSTASPPPPGAAGSQRRPPARSSTTP
ncbi:MULTISPECIES: GNAT family N-acetyltransferase [unclassified Parafrankia]|uniref:GNAT family N-acetyltransferase n=1 Tax=unclassified Parafrankia TaxID=2994368 RepID=UPI000DA5792B|nr:MULTISPECIES: hypothetical protein [unclassified Parafrankia]TCJ32698.1 hypothetical protein E0504_42190 [Parafrankia sp. BMG5.11]SQD96898.1 hypothetical protein FMEAI12_3810003 [Parafrankia sp. Ea1.12]